jgi:stress-induced morphogen
MCIKVTCSTCQKLTWKGCGLHIDSALQGVAECDRCSGWKTGICQSKFVSSTSESTSGGEKKDNTNEIPDLLTPSYLEERIQSSIKNITHISVEDQSDGCGSKFVAVVVTDAFDGVKRLSRHRMINGKEGCLKEEMEKIHALTLNLYTVKEYEKKKAKLKEGK